MSRSGPVFISITLLLLFAGFLLRAQTWVAPHGKPLDSPECVKASEARGERDGDDELCVSRKGEFCAYPLRMMDYHRIVNDHLGGVILVVYDPASGVGQMYDRMVEGKELSFDRTDAVNGLPALKDRETKSTWSALTGEAVAGPLKGKRLAWIPSIIMTWGRWKAIHPDSYVLKENAALSSEYTERITPITGADTRLAPGIPHSLLVLGVHEGDKARAYPLADLERAKGVLTETFYGHPLVLFSDGMRGAAAYRPSLNGQAVRFTAQSRQGVRVFLDTLTHSVWTIEGVAVEGPLKGAKLTPAPFARSRWYAWATAYPNTDLWRPRRAAAPVPFSAGR